MATVDNFFIAISFFGLAIFFIAIMLFWSGISDVGNDLWVGSSIGSDIRTNTQNFVDTFDFILLLVYFGLHLGILAMVYILRTHPVVYVVAVILIAILIMVSASISNAYADLISETEINVVSSTIPITNYILEQFPKFEAIWGFITAIIMFGLARTEGII